MAGETIFFTPVGAPAGVLDARSRIYGEALRNSDAHAWLNQKMAYADASAHNKINGNKASLDLATGGGIRGGGLYEPGDTSAGRYLPKPHITNIKISSEGDFGSILKCDISFAVYNLNDLNAKQAFFDLGAEVKVNYGWNRGGSAAGAPGYFEGFVTNFNYAVNTQGGFDCICNAYGKGMAILSVNSNPAGDDKGKKVADALGNEVIGDTAMGILDVLVQNKGGAGEGVVDADGIGCVMFPTSWGSSETPAGDAEADTPHYFVTLEKLVENVVERIHEAAPVLKDIIVQCDGTVTKGNVPTGGSAMFVSGNPKEILFPGYGEYGPVHKLNFSTYEGEFAAGDLSKTMISITHLNEILNRLGDDKGNNAKSADLSMAKFLNKVFDMINENSGTRFKLSMSQDPKNPNKFLVVDVNYVDATVRPYSIKAVVNGSVCRNITLVSKVPSELASAAYVAGTSAAAPMGAAVATVNGTNPADKPAADPTLGFNAAKKKMDAAGPPDKNDPDGAGPSPKNVNALRAAIKRMYTSGESPNGVPPEKEAIPIPMDFSCTLDGVSGFVFGNAVTTNYLPTAFQNAKMCFTVTHVEHTISANDWTTTLSTVCRVQPTY